MNSEHRFKIDKYNPGTVTSEYGKLEITARKGALIVQTDCGLKAVLKAEELGYLFLHLGERALVAAVNARSAQYRDHAYAQDFTVTVHHTDYDIEHHYHVRAKDIDEAIELANENLIGPYTDPDRVEIRVRHGKPKLHWDDKHNEIGD